MILVTGGSGSGKSEYAENLLKDKKKKVYIATMEPFGKEAQMRIERHRNLRKSKGFETIECCRNLKAGIAGASGTGLLVREPEAKSPVPDETPEETSPSVLLECMSNLAANELYRSDGTMEDELLVKSRILGGVKFLMEITEELVIVTNEVSWDVNGYSEETILYQKVLGEINQTLSGMAEEVYEVVYGIPVRLR